MSYESDFLNFCLSCDTHTTDGPYCSQACRLADLEKSGSPDLFSSSPSASMADSSSPSSVGSSSSSAGFYLPPAVDFSAYSRRERPESVSGPGPRDAVSRSSSISSNDSTQSSSTSTHVCTQACMSESARRELRHYESLFDQTRHRGSYRQS